MRKKASYLEAQIKGYHDHIKDIDQTLFDGFWELMETVGHNFEVERNEYIDIIDMLIMVGNVVVGDYYVIIDNYNVDNLELLREAKRELLEEMEVSKMKWAKLREQKDREALETLIKEMKELGWEKSPDTKERFVAHYIEFQKDEKRIIIEWNEFITFGNNLTVNGYVLIAITKYLQRVKL